MINSEERVEEFCSKLEELMTEYKEFKVFLSVFQRDGVVNWTHSESLCLACVLEWIGDLNKNHVIKHLEQEEMIH